MNEQERLNLIVQALELDNDSELVRQIIENVGNVQVQEIDKRDNEFEVFMRPSGFTNRELENLKQIFELIEIGVYGDPNLPEDTVYFHMIVEV
jgi:hypothetical protein